MGRIHASGKGFVPNVRGDIYAKLLATAGPATQVSQPSTRTLRGAVSNGEGSNTKKPAQGRPRDWDAIAPGHLVVAQESLEDGWYEAIVLEQNGDMFTLRWHEFPRERRFARHRRSLGLLFPNLAEPIAGTGPTSGQQPAKSEKTAAPKSNKGFPLTFEDIDLGHLVLAKDDGPCQSWWEAIPTEKHGDTFTLRWRDHAYLSKIVRARLSLALLCPTAK
jgi:hypothetical protein